MGSNIFLSLLLAGLLLACGCSARSADPASTRKPPSPTLAASFTATPAIEPVQPATSTASGGSPGASPGSSPAIDSKSLPGIQEVAALQVPEAFSSDAVYRGQGLYSNYCAPCHGADGAGARGVTSLLDPRRFRYGSQNRQLLRTILYGIPRTAMGKYSQMTSRQGLDLVAYLSSLQK